MNSFRAPNTLKQMKQERGKWSISMFARSSKQLDSRLSLEGGKHSAPDLMVWI